MEKKFYATADFKAQLCETGLYSKDADERDAAILSSDIEKAKHGSKNGLNACYAAKKNGKLSESEYALIRKNYDCGYNCENSDI